VLTDEKGIAVQTTYLTDYGLICADCIGTIKPHASYPEGKCVCYEYWYQDGIDRER